MLQPIDGFQNQIGNPGLKSYNNYVTSFEAYVKKSGKELYGQTIERNEDFNSCVLSYHYRHCTFRAYLLHPIGHYRGLEREKRSEIVHSKVRNHFNVENTVMLSMVYNIDWGRRKESINRKTNNSSDTGSTQAAGK